MPKKQGRKPPKRQPGRPVVEIDDDLATLALALDEHRLDNSIDGWFEIPWHDGWNAAELAHRAWHRTGVHARGASNAADDLTAWISNRDVSSAIYEAAGSHLGCIAALIFDGVESARVLAASLRCVQLTIANSSGGGHVYNDVLRLAFARFSDQKRYEALVHDMRCKDAIGTLPSLMNDHNDKLRRAFTIAWSRGLYHAAYSLQRAT